MANKKEIDAYNGILAKRIRDTISSKKMTQTKLEELSGIKRQQLSNYANGTTAPSSDILGKLAKALSVSADYLLGLTDDPAPRGQGIKIETVGDVVTILDKIQSEIWLSKRSIVENENYNPITSETQNVLRIDISDPNIVEYYEKYFAIRQSFNELNKKLMPPQPSTAVETQEYVQKRLEQAEKFETRQRDFISDLQAEMFPRSIEILPF